MSETIEGIEEIMLNDDVSNSEMPVCREKQYICMESAKSSSHFPNDYGTMIKTFSPNLSKNGDKKKRKYSVWTKELVGVAKRLFERGLSPKFVSEITDMSIKSVLRLRSQIKPKDSNGQWGQYTVTKKIGAPLKDKSKLHDKIIEILDTDLTLTQKMIADKLPKELKVSRSQISRELKRLKRSKVI